MVQVQREGGEDDRGPTPTGTDRLRDQEQTTGKKPASSAERGIRNSMAIRSAGPSVARRPTSGRVPSIKPPTRPVIATATNLVRAGSAAWFILGTTWIFYAIQFIFALLYLMAMGGLMSYEGSWIESFDIFGWGGDLGAGIFLLCMGLLLAMWFCTFVVAIMIFFLRGVRLGGTASVIVALLSLVLTVVPVANLIPWVWVWCAYVVKTQVSE